MTRAFVVFVLAAIAAIATLGCTRSEAKKKAAPERIVSLSPSTTEAVFAIGAGSLLVGRSRYCNHPPEVAKLPQVGGYVDPSLEAILGLRPDLVVGARGPAGNAITQQLEARGVVTYFPETEKLAAIDDMLLGLGEKTARMDGARAAVAKLHARIDETVTAVAKLPRPKVLLVFGLAPLSVAGPGSFADEMIAKAGGTNVIKEGGAYPTIGAERVLVLDPDVVVNAAMMEENAAERLNANAPGWSAVRAVKEGRVRTIADESVLRPGPRIGDGLALLARAIHPELPAQ
ncbi:MAG: ABC transporter substrate-binding protein [Labilithrix sp.]|nr:ABC transporter substrate-binding protein [Labilithrix sp.]MCW5810424.1 ABC transporter substrate-binding protein [Labilithrix sp.]